MTSVLFQSCRNCCSRPRPAICLSLLMILLAAVVAAQNDAEPAGLKGVVRDSNGHPVTNATVSLQGKTPALLLSTHTDAQGVYSFSPLAAGSYILRADTSAVGQAQFGPFNLGASELKTVDLNLAVGANSASIPFYDEPQFTVAGVTQTGNAGGHGSDTVQRNSEALAKATISLGGSSQGASPERKNVADLERDRADVHARLAHEDTAELHHSLGDIDERLSDPLEAVREYQRAAEMEPSERYLFDWGAELLAHRAAEPAAQVFTKGHRLFPHSARMLVGLAVAQYTRGSYDAAAQCLFEASDLDPSDSTPYLFLGKMLGIETAELHGFVEKFARFAALQPGNALANYYYAVSLWRESKKTDPEDSARQETTNKVRVLLDKSIRLDPKLSAAYLQLGIIASEKGDLQKSITNYQKAVESDSNSVEAHYRLAQAYRRAGRRGEAEQELKIYQELSKQSDAQAERDRREIQQFVVTLRNSSAPAAPK